MSTKGSEPGHCPGFLLCIELCIELCSEKGQKLYQINPRGRASHVLPLLATKGGWSIASQAGSLNTNIFHI